MRDSVSFRGKDGEDRSEKDAGNQYWVRLRSLEGLRDEGYLTNAEFKVRAEQLINEMTGTSCQNTETSESSAEDTIETLEASRPHSIRDLVPSRTPSFGPPSVIPQAPPTHEQWAKVRPETAVKHTFNYSLRKWQHAPILVKIDVAPFARGSLRLVYHMLETKGPGCQSPAKPGTKSKSRLAALTPNDANKENTPITPIKPIPQKTPNARSKACSYPDKRRALYGSGPRDKDADKAEQREVSIHGTPSKTTAPKSDQALVTYCCKTSIDPFEEDDTYLRDIEMQAHCQHYAEKFNMYDPPHRVQFVKAWLLELVDRDNKILCAVERFIEGDYHKHNNNFGFVEDEMERNTPQAFSHFTYEASNHTMLVCDIQGVGDQYTDPQIHTVIGTDFGKGNLGKQGMDKFISTHKCNSICKYLKLPPINPKDPALDAGTVPAQQFMAAQKIEKTKFQSQYYYEQSELYQERQRISSPQMSEGPQRRHMKSGKKGEECVFCTIL